MKDILQISLDESKAKNLAKVITSSTSKKIIEALEKETLTESALAKKLTISLSTIHYNIKQLVEAGIIEAKEYSYSQKGREVNHYSLTQKLIVITPTANFVQKLQQIIPAAIIAIIGGGFIYQITHPFQSVSDMSMKTAMVMDEAAPEVAMLSARAVEPVTETIVASDPNYLFWYSVIVGVLLLTWITILYFKYYTNRK